jgi:hypothetical protein
MLNLLHTMLNLFILPCLYTTTLFAIIFAILLFVTYNGSSNTEKSNILKQISLFLTYYKALIYFLFFNGSFKDCPYFKDNMQAKCHVYSLSLIFEIWDKPHYRNGTFQDDMLKNLRDVAIPGTGIPLHLFSFFRITAYWMVFIGYPIISLVAGIYATGVTTFNTSTFMSNFVGQMTNPQDWFSFWRLNCRLATFHSSLTDYKEDYDLEDKWKFLVEAERLNVAVTPYMKVSGIVCKHRNEEGGLGFESFKNASVGGDWIIQEKLSNGPFLSKLLPDDAPLSTFRIISSSRGGLADMESKNTKTKNEVKISDIEALSCVWRAGRSKAKTDHSAILFNVNPKTGLIKKGTTNVHWYQRGLLKIFTTPWTSQHNYTNHPDTGVKITGVTIPNMKKMMDFVRDAHLRLIPHVPLCGWDVALTPNNGMLLLEGNFSCNFFRGDFDQKSYFQFVNDYFEALDKIKKNVSSNNKKQI